MKFYRGAATAARAYVERDRSRADDYYLGEGAGVAERFVATPTGITRAGSTAGDSYERWVAGLDLETGHKKGRVRDDAKALRFVEVTVNGPKTWSLAAALHPDVSVALDDAQRAHCCWLRRRHGPASDGPCVGHHHADTYAHHWPTAEDKTRAAASGLAAAVLTGVTGDQ